MSGADELRAAEESLAAASEAIARALAGTRDTNATGPLAVLKADVEHARKRSQRIGSYLGGGRG